MCIQSASIDRSQGLENCFVEVSLPIFFFSGCTAAVVWPTGLRNFPNNFWPNLETELLMHYVLMSSEDTVWGGRLRKIFCNMFSESSTGSWAEVQLPCCPSKGNFLKTCNVTKPFIQPAAPGCSLRGLMSVSLTPVPPPPPSPQPPSVPDQNLETLLKEQVCSHQYYSSTLFIKIIHHYQYTGLFNKSEKILI